MRVVAFRFAVACGAMIGPAVQERPAGGASVCGPDGTTTVITVQRRSYVEPGTKVPGGYGSRFDYAVRPDGDPVRPIGFTGPIKTAPRSRFSPGQGFAPVYQTCG